MEIFNAKDEDELRENWRAKKIDAPPRVKLVTPDGRTRGLINVLDTLAFGYFQAKENAPVFGAFDLRALAQSIDEGRVQVTTIPEARPEYDLSAYIFASRKAGWIVEDLTELAIAEEEFEREPDLRTANQLQPFSVQCVQAEYRDCIVSVLACSADDACRNAIASADLSDEWRPISEYRRPFVSKAVSGIGADPEEGAAGQLHIPLIFSETGAPPLIEITLRDGRIENVEFDKKPARVIIRDYDQNSLVDNAPLEHGVDDEGASFIDSYWGDWR